MTRRQGPLAGTEPENSLAGGRPDWHVLLGCWRWDHDMPSLTGVTVAHPAGTSGCRAKHGCACQSDEWLDRAEPVMWAVAASHPPVVKGSTSVLTPVSLSADEGRDPLVEAGPVVASTRPVSSKYQTQLACKRTRERRKKDNK